MSRKPRILVLDADASLSVGASLHRGFLSLGHDSHFFDEAKWLGGHSPSPLRRAINRVAHPLLPGLMHRALLRTVACLRPSVILVMKGRHHPACLVERLRVPGRRLLVFHTDDLRNPLNASSSMLEALPHWDIVFTTRRFALGEILAQGARRVEFLPFGYDPSLHYPAPFTPSETNPWDRTVSFVGTWSAERPPLLEPLLSRCELAIWGSCWESVPRSSPLFPSIRRHTLLGAELRRLLSNTAINLALLRKANRDRHTMRSFEITACGGFMLAERSDEHLEMFEQDREAVFFNGVEELTEKVARYLADPHARRAISEAGHRRLLGGRHTYADRAAAILQAMNR